MNFNWFMPVQVISGRNAVIDNPGVFTALGKRCLIVTGRQSAKACGALDDLTKLLDGHGIDWTVFDEVEQNPRLSTCKRAGQKGMEFDADFVVGIGGGSPLDAAKVAAIFAVNDIPDEEVYENQWAHPALPIVLIGTTAGTGTEITQWAVIVVDSTGRKRTVGHNQIYATVAFADPKYTLSLSNKFTMGTGLDAFSHALEGYFSNAANDLTDFFALRAMGILLPALQAAEGKEAADIPWETREALHYGSLYAGMTLNKCGSCFCHQMGYFLSEQHGVPHGIACALFHPAFIARAVRFMPAKANILFGALGTDADRLVATLRRLTAYTPPKLNEAEREAIVQRCSGMSNLSRSPGGLSDGESRAIMTEIFG